MKLKSLLCILCVLLSIHPVRAATATMTAGTFWTATWTGYINVISQPTGVNDSAFDFTGPAFTASDGGVTIMANTIDGAKAKHSTVIGLVVFNDPHHKDVLGYATFRGTVTATGKLTASLEIVDATTPNIVLFSSGSAEQPLTRGGLFISAAIVTRSILPMRATPATQPTQAIHTDGAPSDAPPPFIAPYDTLR